MPVQPIIRYELGDSIWVRPEPCECGKLFPAIRVQGRTSSLLHFAGARGERVSLGPLQLRTAVDFIEGMEQFQILQTSATTIRVRLRFKPNADPEQVWQTALDSLTRFLESQNIGHVKVERAVESPEHQPGEKFRAVIPSSQ
jgi:phenylacetate-CoA ligase